MTDLPSFAQVLDATNDTLERTNERLIIAIDEYENIDRKIGSDQFSEDLLATLRHSIQNHRQLVWIFAGSHQIRELRRAPWSSYLISVRTIEIPPFTFDETRRLLTDPLQYSTN